MEIRKKILEFLDRNLVLEKDIVKEVRESINDLNKQQLIWIYNVLVDLDNKQTKVLQDKLQETPWFFTEMEISVWKDIYEEHIKEEFQEKEDIEKILKDQLF